MFLKLKGQYFECVWAVPKHVIFRYRSVVKHAGKFCFPPSRQELCCSLEMSVQGGTNCAVRVGHPCWARTGAGFPFFFQGGPHFMSNQPSNASEGSLKIPHLGKHSWT